MLRRLLILMPGLLATSGALLQLGCGDDGRLDGVGLTDMLVPTPRLDGATEASDQGMSPAADMGEPGADDDGYPANPEAGFELDSSEGPTARSSCYSADSTLQCGDAVCGVLPVCCVGATRDGCCDADDRVPPTTVGGSDCTALGCLGTGARAFGVPGPTFDTGLVAGGDGSGDGGIVYEPAIDLRNRTIALTGTVAPPTASCDDGCFETIALALLREAPPSGETVLVQPMAALRYSGANDRMILEAGGEILHRFTEAPAAVWRLEANPAGTLRVLRDGSEVLVLDNRVQPGWVHPAVVGRTRNPSASGGEAARLTTFAVQVDTCDIPAGWAPGVPIDFTEAPSTAMGRPSLWTGDPSLLAVDVDDALRLYRQSVSGRFDPIMLESSRAITDPELVDDSRVIALAEDGAVLTGELTDLAGDASVSWSQILPGCDCDRQSPTTASAFDGTPVLMVLDDGRPRVFAGGGDLGYAEVPELGAVVDALTAPGTDERRTGLSLVLRDQAWHLHVTYARGTRSLVRLFVSEELVVWRALGTAFGPSGEGFDALQVWDFTIARGRDEGALRAVYRGSDGVDPTLGTTTRPAP